jgi:hypothetical protein
MSSPKVGLCRLSSPDAAVFTSTTDFFTGSFLVAIRSDDDDLIRPQQDLSENK